MGKYVFIAEKPSVAKEFAKALHISGSAKDGYIEGENTIVTWCVGHLITMSYPEKYDPKLKRWEMDTLPFIPETFRYEVIDGVKKQFAIVKNLLTREDVDVIYVCTDSGREGEYIYRLVEQEAGVTGKVRKRVWIDSQTEEEIRRGIKEAKDLSAYDNLGAAAYLRAKEDYLMGINFSRAMTLRYGGVCANFLRERNFVISVGRVMTCVLGLVVKREREIRNFVKTPFFRVEARAATPAGTVGLLWRLCEDSHYVGKPVLYKDLGFLKKEDAQELIDKSKALSPVMATVKKIAKKDEKKQPPFLYNLADAQNDCSKRFKISPDQTLSVIQDLYEKKLVTYPRTDARVLSSAIAKVIGQNIKGLLRYPPMHEFAEEILNSGTYKDIAKTRYVNDKQITDHYAIIPTGQGLSELTRLSKLHTDVYELICRRFLSVFYPPAVFRRWELVARIPAAFLPDKRSDEEYATAFRILVEEGFMKVSGVFTPKTSGKKKEKEGGEDEPVEEEQDLKNSPELIEYLNKLKAKDQLLVEDMVIKERETKPPARYTSGSLILAMENAGQFIEDEELRAQIKGSGIGTSATRAEILHKLVKIGYLSLNSKSQAVTPTLSGEMVHDVVSSAMPQLLNPELTASWEKGLDYVANGTITPEEYMGKLSDFVKRRIDKVRTKNDMAAFRAYFPSLAVYYQKSPGPKTAKKKDQSEE